MPTYIVSTSSSSILYTNLVTLSFSIPDIFGGIRWWVSDRSIWRKEDDLYQLLINSSYNLYNPLSKIFHIIVFPLPIIGFMSRAAATALPVLIVESTPRNIVGSILGWYNSIGFIGGATGPYLFGVIAGTAGFTLSFNTISVFPIISAILLYMSRLSTSTFKKV